MKEIDTQLSKQLSSIKDYDDMTRFLDGYSADRKDEMDDRRAKSPYVKSYILEHVGQNGKAKQRIAQEIFKRVPRITIEQIDENLFRISDRMQNFIFGFLEILDGRFFSLYTIHKTEISDQWVNRLVLDSPELDHIWLSGWTFNVLWSRIIEMNQPSRFINIVFKHDNFYHLDQYPDVSDRDADEDRIDDEFEENEDLISKERRSSRFELVDRIGVIEKTLKKLQKEYSPLYAISQLKFPSSVKGGHVIYDNGKITNRSGNFIDHRNHVLYVQKIYNLLMDKTEVELWYSGKKPESLGLSDFPRIAGSPLYISFDRKLNEPTFKHWIMSTFNRTHNKFRLWGNPIWLGNTKVHVYGIDRHLWQPITMEITDKHFLAVIPEGSCGNMVHRLVTNIQRYIDPGANAYIGDKEYKSLVDESSKNVQYA